MLCGGRLQFLPSALKAPHITEYITINKFSPVKRLLNRVDSLTPTAKITGKWRKEHLMNSIIDGKSQNPKNQLHSLFPSISRSSKTELNFKHKLFTGDYYNMRVY